MKVKLLSVGRDRSGLFSPAVEEYVARLSHYCRLEVEELPEGRNARDPARALDEEGKALLGRLTPGQRLVALDERGRVMTSPQLAQWLGKAQTQGRDLAFCIGSADGLSPHVLERAEFTLSLSAMTLPHRLARLVLVEQLYRGFTLLRGEPYHR